MMKTLKVLFRFYINSSIHVAIAVVALTVLTCLEFDISLDLGMLSFVFFSSITGYNFVKYAPIAKLHHRKLTNRLRQIQIFSFLAFVGLMVSVFYINKQTLIVGCILGIITLFYAIPIGRKNLRQVSIFKVFVIAMIWATTSFVFPFLYEGRDIFKMPLIWYFDYVERFIWVVLLMIPFEIRDLRYDQKYLKTLISVFGIKTMKIISLSILILLSIQKLIVFDINNIGLYLFIYSSLALVIIMSKTNQRFYFASFWVEGLPIFWLLMLVLLNL